MASDNLNQVGKYIRGSNRKADHAIKRVQRKLPKRDRAKDTVSSVFPMTMNFASEGDSPVKLDINFNKPPPSECEASCLATTCESFERTSGGYSLLVTHNPYEAGTVRVFSEGQVLSPVQWYEEDPQNGLVYVQIQSDIELIVICYTYVTC
jgi:hypothetical protein